MFETFIINKKWFHFYKNKITGSWDVRSGDYNYHRTFIGYSIKQIKQKIKLDLGITGNFRSVK